MQIQVDNLARQSLIEIYYYNYNYSIKNAIDTNKEILNYIELLKKSPHLGRYIPEINDKRFREIIYRKTRFTGYRIMYYLSNKSNTIYVFNIINCKQDFIKILKLHNYFKNYFLL